MRAFQGSFPRLKERLIYEERGERKLFLHLKVVLFNARTRMVGLNQLLHTFMASLSVEAKPLLTRPFVNSYSYMWDLIPMTGKS